MADTPTEDGPDRSEETAKLELPSLSLPRLGRRRKQAPPDAEADPAQAPTATEAPTATVVEDEPATVPSTAAEPTTPLTPTAPPRSSRLLTRRRRSEPTERVTAPASDEPAVDAAVVQEAEPEQDEETERQPFRLPSLPVRVAAALTGVLVGLAGAFLTYAALQGCDAVRGTETCGGGAGLALLLVILVLMVLLGGVLLAAWRVSESPRGTSFLAVGALAVVAMLTAADQTSVWTFVAVPVLCALTYLLATWVTTTYVEPQPERGPEHDVR
jgi:hypothetical protein